MKVLFLLFLLLTTHGARAAYVENIPRRLTQPDGSALDCLLSGDEFFNYLHDEKGYTIIQGQDGYYYYARMGAHGPEATAYRADRTDPALVGLEKGVTLGREAYQRRKAERQAVAGKANRAPLTGNMANLVIYIRFSDDQEFQTPRSQFYKNFNDEQGPSLFHYFQEVSYRQLAIRSHHFPLTEMTTNLSYQDTNARAYYEPFNAVTNPIGYDPDVPLINSTDPSGLTYREHTLLASAIAYIEGQVQSQLVIDADNDGMVDNISFIIRGEPGQWNSLLWAHRWALWSQTVTLNNKVVYDYTFQPETQSGIYVICHEMYHTLGAPDLYRYSQTGFNPVGPWDVMATGFVHMGAWMKYRYARGKWIQDLPVIADPGTYTLEPLYSSQNNGLRVISPNSEQEFFVLEYRRRQGHYETNIPGEGLVIYRINPTLSGNALGPPDEVYVFRPEGDTLSNGNIFQAFFSLESGRVTFHDESQPGSFLQDGSPGGLFITNIGMAGETITFDLYPVVEGALPPENLVAQANQAYDVVLSWDPPPQDTAAGSPQLAGYRIFRNQNLLAAPDDPHLTSFTDQAPPAGEHNYFIRAVYTGPETVSYGSDIVQVQVPAYFGFAGGTSYEVGWEEGSFTIDLNTNVSAWQVSSSATWCQPATLIGNFSNNLLVMHAPNDEVMPRSAQIAFSGTLLSIDTVITVVQQGHPTLTDPAGGQPLVTVYPNPGGQGPMTVLFNEPVEEGSLELFSPKGIRLLHAPVRAAAGQALDIGTADLAPGIYLLVIRLNDTVIQEKIMILK